MLEINDLCAGYDGIPALRSVDFRVGPREHVAILGPNGAGKTTLLKAISGTVVPDSGSIRFDDRDLLAQAPHKRVEAGIVHVPQGRMIFASMTVADNLRLGSHRRAAQNRHDERRELVFEIFPALADMRGRDGGALSGGQQQMLAVARGVMACPRLLMLDEPSMGLAPRAADDIFEGVTRLMQSETTAMIVVEQRAHQALEVCDRAYVLESGEVALEATSRELLADERLAAAYLGSEL
ncbi:MAG: ABC transporter ATP-binding protein [Acidimicrobiales bacterium]|nr:ABC transporter ATP-binding protein [Acidimicrobiales bacterium]MYD84126.1 ABC transporter ATP-binding protein [Acidimicrobiales bacterium]MYJ65284.1 ABC transporter ATP-binding protein [Acidimicrobiales bacterium]